MATYEEYKQAFENLDTLPYPVFDGSGCRIVDLGTDVYALIDFDDGVYRLGIYWNLPDDDGHSPAEFKHFEDLKAFAARLSCAHAPLP